MILYNVTVSVDDEIAPEWVSWMKEIHIPEVLATGHFSGYRMLRMLSDQADASGQTYAIQYEAETIGHLENYLSRDAQVLREKHAIRYGSRAIAFRTVLEEV